MSLYVTAEKSRRRFSRKKYENSQTRLLLRLFFLCTTGLFSSSSFFIFSPRSIGIATAASYSGGPSWKSLEEQPKYLNWLLQISQLVVTNISTGCFYVTKYLNWLFCYLEGKFEIITRDLVIGGRRQGGSRPTRQRDFETSGQGDPLFENCVVAELKGDLNYFLYLGLKTE